LETIPPKHRGKEGSRANQKARRVNHIATTGPVCKTYISGSNPDAASNISRSIPETWVTYVSGRTSKTYRDPVRVEASM
jgi:hypothetical protein